MAKDFTRLPRPQAGTSRGDGYYAPNLRAPTPPQMPARPAPVALAVDTATEQAAFARLSNALFGFGQTMWDREKDKIQAEEEIRITQLNTDQVRAELKRQAKEAEQSGLLTFGSNPYRRMVAMEYLAERVMRDEFAPTLTSNISRFSNPMSEENAQAFARDTFEGLNIQGGFAQRKASELYNSMSANWLAQVNSQKASRMVAKNRDDLYDASYHFARQYAEGGSNFVELNELVTEKSNTFYELEGDAGRDHIMKGIVEAVRNQSLTAEDADEIDRLQNLVDQIKLQKTGPLALSKDHLDSLDELENSLNIAEKNLGKNTESEIQDDVRVIRDEVNRLMVESEGPIDPDAMWTMVVDSLGDSVSSRALNRYQAEMYRDAIQDYESDQERISPADEKALYDQVDANIHDPDQVEIILSNEDMPPRMRMQIRQYVNSQRQVDMLAKSLANDSAAAQINGAQGQADLLAASATSMNTDAIDVSTLGTMRANSPQMMGNRAVEALIKRGATQEEMNEAFNEAAAAINGAWREVTLGRGESFDLEKARQYGAIYPEVFTPDVLRVMEDMTRESAASAIGVGQTAMELREGQELPEIGLQEGTWIRRAMIDNIDDVRQLHQTPQTPNRDAQINEYNQESRQDSMAFIEAIQGDALDILTATGRPTDEEAQTRMFITLVENRHSDQYIQARRLLGYSPENMRTGVDDMGVPLSVNPDFKSPYKTLMVNPDTVISDLEALSAVEDGLTPEQLQERLPGNGIVEGYLGYRDMVGENNAVSFDEGPSSFVALTLKGIGLNTLPAIPADLIKALQSE
ncbi:MAG: hypothetical protein Unbinned7358contig1001_43 [Prokaryotic dsDNA virus sp.]|nr:MAG: hypothetical protein Unbinned7358contig1001_43 [Prokaryotic dsDNA virus sp.]